MNSIFRFLTNIYKRYLRYDLVVLVETITQIVLLLPRFRLFNAFKVWYLSFFGARFGSRCVLYPGIWIQPGRKLTVGTDVDFAVGVLLTTSGGVVIGDRVLIGYGSKIISSNHRIPRKHQTIFNSGHVYEPVTIENDVWIGANVIILPGAIIREGSVIAAGAVVSGDIPPFSIAAGVPAKVIKKREF